MTSPDRPTIPTSTGDMLARTHRRAEQLRRRRRGLITGLAAAAVVIAVAVPLLARSPHRSRVVGVTGEPTSVTTGTTTPQVATTSPGATTTAATTIPPVPSIPVPTTTATTGVPRTPTTAPASTPECATSQLRGALTNSSGAAGSVGYAIEFVNTAATTCSLTGYPGVSYRSGATETLVGAPAQRDPLRSVVTVTLRPGQAAYATLIEVDSLNYPPASCQLTSVNGLWVYPPDQTAALFLSQSTQACSNPADPVLMIGPIGSSST
jgi:hypothetical protein